LTIISYLFFLDLELDSEDNSHGLAAQPVRKNISLKLKTKSSKTSSMALKPKKKESRSSDRKSSAEGMSSRKISSQNYSSTCVRNVLSHNDVMVCLCGG